MRTYEDIAALTGSIKLPVSILVTRRRAHEMDPPYFPPAYTSLIDDVMIQNSLHLRQDKLRQIALHPVKLHAGQANLPGGELGRPAAREQVLVPEMTGGRVLTTNV